MRNRLWSAPLRVALIGIAISMGTAGAARAQAANEFYDFSGTCIPVLGGGSSCGSLGDAGTAVAGKIELQNGTFVANGSIENDDIIGFLLRIGTTEIQYLGDFFTLFLTDGPVGNFLSTPEIERIGFADSSSPRQTFEVTLNVEDGPFFLAEFGGQTVAGSPTGFTQGEPPVVEELSAEANGPYVYDASTLTVQASAAGSTGNIQLFDWTSPTTDLADGELIDVPIADSGLTMTTTTSTFSLTVTDDRSETASDDADVLYNNAAPSILSAGATATGDGGLFFDALFTDPDLIVEQLNASLVDFELLTFEFDVAQALGAGDVGDGFLTGPGALGLGDLTALFGGTGTFTAWANVRDKAGAFDTFPFEIVIAEAGTPPPPPPPPPQVSEVPEPAPLPILAAAAALIGIVRVRRKRAHGPTAG